MLTEVHFSTEFVEAIRDGFLELPRDNVKVRTPVVYIGEADLEGEHVWLDGSHLYELAQIQQELWAKQLPPDTVVELQTLEHSVIVLEYDDISTLLYTVEKVISGADPVTLDGNLQVYTQTSTG